MGYSPEFVENRNSPKFAVAISPARVGPYGLGTGLRGVSDPNWCHAGRIRGEELLRALTGCCVPTSWELLTGVRGMGILGSSLPASHAQVTTKIAHLSDTPVPIRKYARHVTDKGTP